MANLRAFNTIAKKEFKESVKSKNWLLNKIIRYELRSKGKQIRPMFVCLAAC